MYNDHGLDFFLDKMPTFAVGAARNIRRATKAGVFVRSRRRSATPTFPWHAIESLVDDEFDVTICQELRVDHGFPRPDEPSLAGSGRYA